MPSVTLDDRGRARRGWRRPRDGWAPQAELRPAEITRLRVMGMCVVFLTLCLVLIEVPACWREG